MKKKFSILFIINILFYLNNFLYLIFSSEVKKGILYDLWIISPVILVVLSFNLIEYSYKNKLGIKNKSITDFVIRVLACIAVFYSKESQIIFFSVTNLIMLITNILVEVDIMKEIRNNNYYKDVKEVNLYENEKLDNLIKRYYYYKNMDLDKCDIDNRYEVDKMFRLEKMEKIANKITFWLLYTPIIFLDDFQVRGKIIFGAILLISFFIYLYLSREKFRYFYKDNIKLNQKNIINSILLFVGVTVIYIIKGFIYEGNLIDLSLKYELWIIISFGAIASSLSTYESKEVLNRYSIKE